LIFTLISKLHEQTMIDSKLYRFRSVARFKVQPLGNRCRRGAMLVMILILLPVLLSIAAYAVNLAHIESAHTEIRIANDVAAKAAGRVYSLTGDRDLALEAAQEAADNNPIFNEFVLPIEDSDLTIGSSTRPADADAYQFTPSFQGNSVRIMTQSLADGDGNAIGTLLPIFGFQSDIRPLLTSISTQSDIDIALVIDRSGSMAYASNEIAEYPPAPAAAPAGWDFGAPVPPQSRWLDLVAAIDVFRNALNDSPQEEMVSLSVYNDESATLVELTDDYAQLSFPLDEISNQFDIGGTNIGDGMLRGLNTLTNADQARTDAAKVIIVLTDGVHNLGTSPFDAARISADRGVSVFTITFSDEAKQGDMETVADIAGGSHIHAVTGDALKQAFVDIVKQLPNVITE
jgi:Mg-chelatase subunit ChlD